MRADTLAGQIIAVLSRRAPAYQPLPNEPVGLAARLSALWHARQATLPAGEDGASSALGPTTPPPPPPGPAPVPAPPSSTPPAADTEGHSLATTPESLGSAGQPGAELPPAPEMARGVFGERYADAVRYAELLADAGVRRGVIGPQEVPRLWEHHLLHCAVLSEVIPHGVSVCDLGSGAGLPGIPLALTRPDLSITLLEPLQRRTMFLEEVVRLLGLSNVTVVRGRAEDMVGTLPPVDVVTARAVAPLDRLAGWALPLLRPHGEMAVLERDTAEEELKAARAALIRLGVVQASVVQVGEGIVDPMSTVVRVWAGESPGGARTAARRAKVERARRRSPS